MKLKITVDGKLYEVDVEVSEPEPAQPGFLSPQRADVRVPAAAPVARPRLPPRADARRWPTRARSAAARFAGTVSQISAQAGQTIQVNDVLLVLEAMKMETVITAPIAGKVAKINVNAGDAVQQGQVLVEFE